MMFRTQSHRERRPSCASRVFMLSVIGKRSWRGFASNEKRIWAMRQHEDIKRYGVIRPVNVR